jgi:hypothetical protein
MTDTNFPRTNGAEDKEKARIYTKKTNLNAENTEKNYNVEKKTEGERQVSCL